MDELNRDLLMAVLALLTDAVPRDALFAALGDWAKDRRQTLSQVLVRNRAIDPEHLRALICLAETHLARHQNDLRACLDVWHAQGLTEEVLAEVEDVGLKTTLGVAAGLDATLASVVGQGGGDETIPASAGLDETIAVGDGVSAGPVIASPPAAGERFRPLRPHAKGGIGQVWVARDGELQREVALKVIQDRFAEHPDQRARFLLEAEITGNLEHPGIVPVYSLGRDAQGRPYYAMRFVRGESLAAAIRRFHLRWNAKDAEAGHAGERWGVEFQELLGRFLDVCDAIAYAHSRGVLHRDLKPANVMLGRYGETLVVDWGLAKVIGKPDIVPVMASGDAEPTLTASGVRSSSEDTQPGTLIGTPSYMSPEQARGAHDEMGPASDVYSLGATLYELLTGRVAFQGEKTKDVIQRVVKGDFPPPRAVLRSVPAALEAICLKAMALERRDRYDTVRELAHDIRHWLADEPVVAYPEGRLRRLGRWLRRHRTWTYAAAAALIGISVAATIGMVLLDRGRRREVEARELAQKNYNLARKAVEDYFTRVSEDTLLKSQDSVDMRPLRGELLKLPLEYYREFLRQKSDDPALRRELADAQFRVGQIMREIGTPDEATVAFQAAIAIWEELLAASPGDPDLRLQLARSCVALGGHRAWTRDFPRALASLTRARDILKGLEASEPTNVLYQDRLAECDKELGVAEADGGEPDQALEWLKEAEAILRRLLATSPGDARYLQRLAETINSQGYIHDRKGHADEALQAFREFQRICQSLLEGHQAGPKPSDLLSTLAFSYHNVGVKLRYRDREQALENFEKALEYRTLLAETHASVNDYRNNLAVSLREVALLCHETGRDVRSFDLIHKSIDIFKKLVATQPDQPLYRAELGRALNNLGYFLDEARENAQAVPVLEEARDAAERAVRAVPNSDLYRSDLITILANLGEQYADLGQADKALPPYREAVLIQQRALEARPGDRGRILGLADQLALLAGVERHGGFSEEARGSYARALTVLAPLAAEVAATDVQVRRGALLMGKGLAAADRGRQAEALALLRQAVTILRPFGSSAKDDPGPRWRLTEALWECARLARSTGADDEADRLDAERRALWQGRPPDELVGLVMEEIMQAARIGYGRMPVGDRVAAVRRLDRDLATENLRLAVALGFRDFTAIRKRHDSSHVLSPADVRALIDDAAFPESPFGPDGGKR